MSKYKIIFVYNISDSISDGISYEDMRVISCHRILVWG